MSEESLANSVEAVDDSGESRPEDSTLHDQGRRILLRRSRPRLCAAASGGSMGGHASMGCMALDGRERGRVPPVERLGY